MPTVRSYIVSRIPAVGGRFTLATGPVIPLCLADEVAAYEARKKEAESKGEKL